jgi:hypothetical protein
VRYDRFIFVCAWFVEEEFVRVRCFGCDATIEADGADDVVDAFVVHGRERHTWQYPGEAIRNYARNYAEASERLSGGTERFAEIGDDPQPSMNNVVVAMQAKRAIAQDYASLRASVA